MQHEIDRTRLLKKIVPSLAVIALIALVFWPFVNSKEGSFTLAIDRLDKRDENAKLIKPRYVGIDKHNHPVNISAETAFRKNNDDNDYYLKNLLADLKMSDGTGIKIRATSGMFDADVQEITLNGTVEITTENNFHLITDHTLFLINEKIATGNHGMTGSTSFGTLRADRFHVDVNQEIIRLKGNVKMHFDPQQPIELPKLNNDK